MAKPAQSGRRHVGRSWTLFMVITRTVSTTPLNRPFSLFAIRHSRSLPSRPYPGARHRRAPRLRYSLFDIRHWLLAIRHWLLAIRHSRRGRGAPFRCPTVNRGTRGGGRNSANFFLRNEPNFPPWRYRERRFSGKNEPKRTQETTKRTQNEPKRSQSAGTSL